MPRHAAIVSDNQAAIPATVASAPTVRGSRPRTLRTGSTRRGCRFWPATLAVLTLKWPSTRSSRRSPSTGRGYPRPPARTSKSFGPSAGTASWRSPAKGDKKAVIPLAPRGRSSWPSASTATNHPPRCGYRAQDHTYLSSPGRAAARPARRRTHRAPRRPQERPDQEHRASGSAAPGGSKPCKHSRSTSTDESRPHESRHDHLHRRSDVPGEGRTCASDWTCSRQARALGAG